MKKLKFIFLIIITIFITGCSNNNYNTKNKDINVNDYYYGNQRENVNKNEKIYIWNDNNIPTITTYSKNTSDYFDDVGFRPYLTVYEPVKGSNIKGALLISPGGAFMFRSEIQEGVDVAKEFAKLGYISFVVHYRVNPYTESESGIDVARSIKVVRNLSDKYGFNKNNVGVVGFSAGGIANGHAILDFSNKDNFLNFDSNYKKDNIDELSSMPYFAIMGYSFYGKLSVADLDEDTFKDFDLPPTYYVYGTEVPFYNQFNEQVALLKKLNKDISVNVLNNYPHGFGATGNWEKNVDKWINKLGEKSS